MDSLEELKVWQFFVLSIVGLALPRENQVFLMPKFGIDRACAPLGAIETALAFTDGGYLDDMGKVQQLFQSHRRFHWI